MNQQEQNLMDQNGNKLINELRNELAKYLEFIKLEIKTKANNELLLLDSTSEINNNCINFNTSKAIDSITSYKMNDLSSGNNKEVNQLEKRKIILKISEQMISKLDHLKDSNLNDIDIINNNLNNLPDISTQTLTSDNERIKLALLNGSCYFVKKEELLEECRHQKNPIGILVIADWYLDKNQFKYLNFNLKNIVDEEKWEHNEFNLNQDVLNLAFSLFGSGALSEEQKLTGQFNFFKKKCEQKLKEVEELSFNASYNIQSIDADTFRTLEKCKKLHLNGNKIVTLDAGIFANSLPQLEILYLGANRIDTISDFTFQSLIKLKELYLFSNNLDQITENMFSGLVNLERLHLYGNQIKTMDQNSFKSLAKLKKLDLGQNCLKNIDEYCFKYLINLEHLDLCENPLQAIKINLFKSLTKLLTLNVDRIFSYQLNDCYFFDELKIVDKQPIDAKDKFFKIKLNRKLK